PEEGLSLTRLLGHPWAGKPDHGWRNPHPNDLVPGVGECSAQTPAATSEVRDDPLGDAVLSEQAQEARCRASGKLAEAGVVDVGQIAMVRGHVELALLPCFPLQNGQNGQSSPWGKSSPSSCGQPMLPSVMATDLTPCWR